LALTRFVFQAELSETGNELEEALGRVEALEEELASVKWKARMWDAQGGEAGASCSPADVVPRKRARSQGCSPSSLKVGQALHCTCVAPSMCDCEGWAWGCIEGVGGCFASS
jgi:hypothetical protein